MKDFIINGDTYTINKNLKIGQIRQLIELDVNVFDLPEIKDTDTSEEKANKHAEFTRNIIRNVDVSKLIAIILYPKSYQLRDKNLEKLSSEVDDLTASEVEEIVTFFFEHCPLTNVIEDMIRLTGTGRALMYLT